MSEVKDVAACTMADIGMKITGEDAQPLIDTLNEYLSEFAKPSEDGKCLNCERKLGGMFGTFQWGIANGEGNCSECGWPARALHRPKDSEGMIFDQALQVILQYHPDSVMKKESGHN